MHGEEETLHGDSGYIGANKRPEAIRKNKNGKKIKYQICRKPSSIQKLSKSGQYAARKKEVVKVQAVQNVGIYINGELELYARGTASDNYSRLVDFYEENMHNFDKEIKHMFISSYSESWAVHVDWNRLHWRANALSYKEFIFWYG